MMDMSKKMEKILAKEGLKDAVDKLRRFSYNDLVAMTTKNSLLRKYEANYEELVFFIIRDFLLIDRLPEKRSIVSDRFLEVYDSCSLYYIGATEEKMANIFGDWLEDKGHFDI